MKRKRKSSAACLAVLIALTAAYAAPAQQRDAGEAFEETSAPEVDLSQIENGDTPAGQEQPATGAAQFPPGFLDELNRELGAAEEEGGAAPPAEDAGAAYDLKRPAIKALATLCVVLALILLTLYGARRFFPRNPLLAGARFGSVAGRLHLSPRTCLYLIRMGGRILVVGVTNNAIAPIAEFEAGELEIGSEPGRETKQEEHAAPRAGFLEYLWARRPSAPAPGTESVTEDDDLKALRTDIQRLQEQLRNVSGALDE